MGGFMDKIDKILKSGEANVVNSGSGRSFLIKEIKDKVVPRAKKLDCEWLCAKQVMDVLNEMGHNRRGANAVGDAMGKHSDGLNLPTKLVNGKKFYQISALY